MRLTLSILAIAFCVATAALAEAPILSAPEAQEQIAKGELVLLDIRRPREWRATGVAEGAWPVSMHDRDFGARLQNILKHVPADQIALICATGGRTAYLARLLEKNGIHGVADVTEGMMGNGKAPGWIARGMPLVTAEEAVAAFDAVSADW